MTLFISVLLLSFGLLFEDQAGATGEGDELTITAPFESVILYLHGAQLTHKASFEIPEGRHRVVFSGLNSDINAESVTLGLSDQMEILSINHRMVQRRQTENAEEIESLLEEKTNLESTIRSLQIDREVIEYEMEMLGMNRVPDAQNQAAFRELLELHRERIRELKTESNQIEDSLQSARERVNEINRTLQRPHLRPFVTEGELVVDVVSAESEVVDAVISYPVRRAGWLPEYEIRAQNPDESISIRLNAVVFNNSMQSWNDVEVKLSTGTPQMGIDLPVVRPWFLDFIRSQTGVQPGGANVDPERSNRISGHVYDAQTGEYLPGATLRIANKNIGVATRGDGSYELTAPPGSSQITVSYIGYKSITAPITNTVMDFRLQPDAVGLREMVVSGMEADFDRTAMPPPSVRSETMVSRTFELRDKQTIPSDGESHRINVEQSGISPEFSYLAIPKVREEAMLIADIEEWESVFALPGPAMLHLEGTFVGQTYIDPQTVSETLRISFGRDQGIIVSRSKVNDESSRSFFRNRVTQRIAQEITVRNTRNHSVQIEIIDQIPVSMRDQIEVSAVELSGGELAEDTGIVTWNLTIGPTETVVQNLVYEVRYPDGQSLRLE